MTIFRPNTKVQVYNVIGSDVYGQPVKSNLRYARVQIISFQSMIKQTPLRQEMSGSHGRLDEHQGSAIMMFEKNFNINMNDIIFAFGAEMVVDSVWPRMDVVGSVAYKQVNMHVKLS